MNSNFNLKVLPSSKLRQSHCKLRQRFVWISLRSVPLTPQFFVAMRTTDVCRWCLLTFLQGLPDRCMISLQRKDLVNSRGTWSYKVGQIKLHGSAIGMVNYYILACQWHICLRPEALSKQSLVVLFWVWNVWEKAGEKASVQCISWKEELT